MYLDDDGQHGHESPQPAYCASVIDGSLLQLLHSVHHMYFLETLSFSSIPVKGTYGLKVTPLLQHPSLAQSNSINLAVQKHQFSSANAESLKTRMACNAINSTASGK